MRGGRLLRGAAALEGASVVVYSTVAHVQPAVLVLGIALATGVPLFAALGRIPRAVRLARLERWHDRHRDAVLAGSDPLEAVRSADAHERSEDEGPLP